MEEDNINAVNDVDKPEPKKKRKPRGPTTGVKDKKKGDSGVQMFIDFDEYDNPIGPYRASFSTEMGVVARGLKITYGEWPKVPVGKKDTIWLHVKKMFNIEDDKKRKVVLSMVGSRYKAFKTRLAREYIHKKEENTKESDDVEESEYAKESEDVEELENVEKLNDDPCKAYGITKEDWEEFKKDRTDPKYQEKREKARLAQSFNTTPHNMGRAGYSGKAELWLKEEIANQTLLNPGLDPIAIKEIAMKKLKERSYKWLKGRTPASSAPPPETQKIIDKIHYWSKMEETGEFVPTRSEDVLVKATGKKEHSGRTRGVGSFVGNQKYFGKPIRAPREKVYTAQEVDDKLETVRRQTTSEMKHVFIEMAKACGIVLPSSAFQDDEEASNPFPSQHDQTCSPSIGQRDPFVDLKDPISCQLGVHDGNTLVIVAEGTARPWKENTVVHHTPLSPLNVHVSIDKCLNLTAPLPVPWSGFETVGEAEGSFAQWPKKWVLLRHNEEPCPDKMLKRKERSKDTKESRNKIQKKDETHSRSMKEVNSVGGKKFGPYCQQLEGMLVSLSQDSISMISIDINESVYNAGDVTVDLNCKDITEMFNYDSPNMGIIQTWGSFLYDYGRSLKVTEEGVGFMCPVQLSSYLYDSRAMEDYVKNVLKIQQDKKYVIGAFCVSKKWMLVVICPWDNTAYIFHSKKEKHDLKIKQHLQLAWKLYTVVAGTRNPLKKNGLQVKVFESAEQSGGFEFGYCVMKWMYDIIVSCSKSQNISLECISKSRMTIEDMDKVRELWSQKCIEWM